MKDNKMTRMTIKKQLERTIDIIGNYANKYRKFFIVSLIAIAIVEVFFMIYWKVSNEIDMSERIAMWYMVSYVFMFVVSIMMVGVLLLSKKYTMTNMELATAIHLYCFLVMIWATLVSVLDLSRGSNPVINLTMILVIGGIFVISPMAYGIMIVDSWAIIIGLHFKYNFAFFNTVGSASSIAIYLLMAILMSWRLYQVYIREHIQKKDLEYLTYFDQLTGLGNERSYFMECDQIAEKIKNKEGVNFGVVVVDVNNLKNTNDQYGHRYGSHLIKEGGKKLPDIFKTSKVYHVGGDEFVVIVYGDDLTDIHEKIKEFDDSLKYKKIVFEDNEIVLSLARGYSVYEKGKDYKSVFQEADNQMYENKDKVKEEYNLTKR